jgi:hypothetical protein
MILGSAKLYVTHAEPRRRATPGRPGARLPVVAQAVKVERTARPAMIFFEVYR